jgi:hypothetical protein
MRTLKEGVREEEEAELLDVIWSLQYHIDTILSLYVGVFDFPFTPSPSIPLPLHLQSFRFGDGCLSSL